jgi:tRNA (guanine37-N1)-methyltransferase
MLKIAVITIFPEMFGLIISTGVNRKAFDKKIVELLLFNPRDYTEDAHKTVDDRPFGGGPGMVMMYDPLYKALKEAKKSLGDDVKVVYLSPQGNSVTQKYINSLSKSVMPVIFICGRYEGIDERFIDECVDEEVSIGDYVVSGGELPAMMIMDAMIRMIPGVLGHHRSAIEDSFYDGLLDCPHYTRPAVVDGVGMVPDVLLSGHHEKISLWRKKQSLGRTYERRPEMIDSQCLSEKDIQLLAEYKNEKRQCKQNKGEFS